MKKLDLNELNISTA